MLLIVALLVCLALSPSLSLSSSIPFCPRGVGLLDSLCCKGSLVTSQDKISQDVAEICAGQLSDILASTVQAVAFCVASCRALIIWTCHRNLRTEKDVSVEAVIAEDAACEPHHFGHLPQRQERKNEGEGKGKEKEKKEKDRDPGTSLNFSWLPGSSATTVEPWVSTSSSLMPASRAPAMATHDLHPASRLQMSVKAHLAVSIEICPSPDREALLPQPRASTQSHATESRLHTCPHVHNAQRRPV